MKIFQRLILSMIILGNVTFINHAYAVNEADCSIWLCLPTGFGSGCGDAKKAFKNRIKKFKPPLPDLLSCLIGGDEQPAESSKIDSKDGVAAFIPERTICKKWDRDHFGNKECVKHETIPTHVIKDQRCYFDSKFNKGTPTNCTRTIRYVDTYMDGQKYGETYFYDNSGNEIKIP